VSGFTPEEVRVLKALAAGLLNASGVGAVGVRESVGGQAVAASDSALNGQWGDPTVRRDPKRWAGDTCVGLKFSECPTDFLECLAEFLEWKVGMNRSDPDAKRHTNGKFYWEFDWRDAGLARGWVRRIRADEAIGKVRTARKAQPHPADDAIDYGGCGDDEIPF
jgi:hypothetical protein